MFEISNVEFILLALIHEQQKVTGYHLNTLVDARGYREWADIGTTSIYVGLKKLKDKGYVTSAADRHKTGRGPKGVKYALTEAGLARLQHETELGLSQSREQGGCFMLALSALPVLPADKARAALEGRCAFLRQEYARVRAKYAQQPPMPTHAELLFQYSFENMHHEMTVTEHLLAALQGQAADNDKEGTER